MSTAVLDAPKSVNQASLGLEVLHVSINMGGSFAGVKKEAKGLKKLRALQNGPLLAPCGNCGKQRRSTCRCMRSRG